MPLRCMESFGPEEGGRVSLLEGDARLVLPALEKSYLGSVKLVYIDPPYNTGNKSGRVYSDTFEWKDWHDLMDSTISEAKRLMREDGTFWMSVTEGFLEEGLSALNRVFGRKNRLAMIAWRGKTTQQNMTGMFISEVMEYVLVYAKSQKRFREAKTFFGQHWRPEEGTRYNHSDERGLFTDAALIWSAGRQGGYKYALTLPSGRVVETVWIPSEASFRKLESEGLVFYPTPDSLPRKKIYWKGEKVPRTYWNPEEVGSYPASQKALEKLFGQKGVFHYPKPIGLLQRIVQLTTSGSDIVLDFFAGSGTTGAAVWAQNREDGGQRHCLLVQRPEPSSGPYPTVFDITRERLTRCRDSQDGLRVYRQVKI